MRDQERSPEETIRFALRACVRPSRVLDALEALAVLGRQLADAKDQAFQAEANLKVAEAMAHAAERQLAEKDAENERLQDNIDYFGRDRDAALNERDRYREALRLIASDHPGFDTGWQQAWQAAGHIAREALRVEPAKEEA